MRMFPPAWVRLAALALAAALVLLAPPGSAKTLRLASAFDPQTLDPHALTLLYHSRVITQVYEGLVSRDRDFRLEPALAVSWDNPSPTTWRFRLRPGVRFHDGSMRRAYAMNNHREYFAEITEAYFGTNDFYPFNRAELARHDPEGFELMERIWRR